MIQINAIGRGSIHLKAYCKGVRIYLDNFAFKDLAKGDPERRRRFVAALHSGADILFSITNAAELTGPQEESRTAIKIFLDEIGRNYYPVELDPHKVTTQNLRGLDLENSCIAIDFQKRVLAAQMQGVLQMTDDMLGLGKVLDVLAPQRESIKKGLADLDDALVNRINLHLEHASNDPHWIDEQFPPSQYNTHYPAAFTYLNLVRTLILDAKHYRLKKGDGADFCHAFMASTFAHVAALDKHWKRRIETLPQPNSLARIYYQPELDQMVTDIESLIKRAVRMV